MRSSRSTPRFIQTGMWVCMLRFWVGKWSALRGKFSKRVLAPLNQSEWIMVVISSINGWHRQAARAMLSCMFTPPPTMTALDGLDFPQHLALNENLERLFSCLGWNWRLSFHNPPSHPVFLFLFCLLSDHLGSLSLTQWSEMLRRFIIPSVNWFHICFSVCLCGVFIPQWKFWSPTNTHWCASVDQIVPGHGSMV